MKPSALTRRRQIAAELRAMDPDRPAGRKTSATRAPRAPPHLRPDWVVTFIAPDLTGATVTFRSPNKAWVLQEAGSSIRAMTFGRHGRLDMTITRAGSPHQAMAVEYGPDGVVIIEGRGEHRSMRKIG